MRPAGGLAHPFGGLHGPATHRRPSIRERGRPNSSGYITNISRSGAFVRLTTLPARGSVVELDLSLPDLAGYHTVHAYVVPADANECVRREYGRRHLGGGPRARPRVEMPADQQSSAGGSASEQDLPAGYAAHGQPPLSARACAARLMAS